MSRWKYQFSYDYWSQASWTSPAFSWAIPFWERGLLLWSNAWVIPLGLLRNAGNLAHGLPPAQYPSNTKAVLIRANVLNQWLSSFFFPSWRTPPAQPSSPRTWPWWSMVATADSVPAWSTCSRGHSGTQKPTSWQGSTRLCSKSACREALVRNGWRRYHRQIANNLNQGL